MSPPSPSNKKSWDTNAVHGQTTESNPKPEPSLQGTAGGASGGHQPSARERLASLASHLVPQGRTEYDYVIIGGGTAGAVLANRLTQDKNVSVAVIEGGPSDVGNDKVLDLNRWLELLGSDLDYDYPTIQQPKGNSFIRHSRAKVLGGCSSHNTLISFRPFNQDLDLWANYYDCPDWHSSRIQPYGDRLKMNIIPIAPQQRNQVARDWVDACEKVTGAPRIGDFNAQIAHRGGFTEGVGFFNIAYDPYNNTRSSASVAYLHPIMPHGPHKRNNLHLFLETWARELVFDQQDAKKIRGVSVKSKYGVEKIFTATKDVIICAGAIDTPRLMLLSGIGPKADLEKVGIECKHDLPGVGENLHDHPESIIIWETRETPPETVMSSDAGLFLKVFKEKEPFKMDDVPDLMFHIYQVPFCDNTKRLGYPVPDHAICMTPNICRSQARGKLSLASANPNEKPLLDFKYFEDSEDYDAKILVEGIKWSRKIAQQSPFKEHLVKEIAPGVEVQSDKDLSEYARRAAHTVYHPAGTCKMGTHQKDEKVVVDQSNLRVVGLKGIRICDASVLPILPTINPMLTILMVAERTADIITTDAWAQESGERRQQWP